jgi:hypothetical protein
MLSGRTSGPLFGAALAVVVGAGCIGLPDMATEEGDPTALSSDGRRMRLIYRSRGWAENRESYELYSKVPYVSSSSLTVMGLRLAMPTKWPDNSPVSLITFDTRWWSDAEMAIAIFHRPEGTTGNWEPLRCAGAPAGTDLQYFHASQALIDLQNGELELVPVAASAGTTDPSAFERDGAVDRSRDPSRREAPRNVTLSTFQQCGISELNPEFSAFVFPYSVSYWSDRFDYDLGAACDGDPCPAYRGDPNEPRRRNNNNNGNNNNNNNNWVNPDPNRLAWDVTDDGVWQCGRTTVQGQGSVSTVRVDIRGRHARFSELEATLKKISGMTNVAVFSTNSGLSFPVTRTVTTSNEAFAGTWELCLRDTQRNDMGRVDGWSLAIDQLGAGGGLNGGGGGLQAGVTAVTAGASRNDQIAVNESDWYSITLQANQTLTVETSGVCAQNTIDTVVSLHSSLPANRPTGGSCPSSGSADWTNGATLDCQDQAETGAANGYCTRLEERVVNAGTYYIRMFGYGNDDAGAYTISFQVR